MPDLSPIFPHLAPLGMVLARLTGIFIYAPILSSPLIPRIARVYLVVALTLAVYTAVLPSMQVSVLMGSMNVSAWTIVPVLGFELLIGLVVGFIAMIPLAGIQLAGHEVAQQFGLAIAQESDPNLQSNVSSVGILLFYLALSIFLTIGGISVLFAVLLNSFDSIPIGGFRVDVGLIDIVAGTLNTSFELAARIAAPIFCIMFVQSVSLGFLSRTAPSFNILSLGFPIRVMLGLSAMIASIAFIYDAIENVVFDTLDGLLFLFT